MTRCSYENKTPIFGSPIITAIARSSYLTDSGLMVPGIVARCIHEINKDMCIDLNVEGLFRRSGAASQLDQLQNEFEQTENPFHVKPSMVLTVHYWTGLLKRYLQLLPEPLIPRTCQQMFLDAFESGGTQSRLDQLHRAIRKLPLEHRHLLQYLLLSIQVMVQHGEANHMSASTLAIIVAPTFIQLDGISQLMQHTPHAKTTKVASWQRAVRRFMNLSHRRGGRAKNPPLLSPSLKSVPFALYQPQNIMQLDLVKQSAKWAEIMEHLILNAHLLVRPRTSKTSYGSTDHVKTRSTRPMTEKTHRRAHNAKKSASTSYFDMTNLQFSESKDLLAIFDDVHTPVLAGGTQPREVRRRSIKKHKIRSEHEHSTPDAQKSDEIKQQPLPAPDWLRIWSKKSLSTETSTRNNIAPSHLQLFQHPK
ncbi:Rho GTPase activation protein [Gongronella butleri]|nr:Rho GTPase activation protein [Gongronella butleri]